jgi:hypothetical protein
MIQLGHPDWERKMKFNVEAIVVAIHPEHKTNCFMMVRYPLPRSK